MLVVVCSTGRFTHARQVFAEEPDWCIFQSIQYGDKTEEQSYAELLITQVKKDHQNLTE